MGLRVVADTLSQIAAGGGGTEFAPGSHQWGESYSEEPCYAAQTCATKVFEQLPPGTAVFVSATTPQQLGLTSVDIGSHIVPQHIRPIANTLPDKC